MITIAAEQFTLTTAIRTHVENNLFKLRDLMPYDASIQVFLSEPAHNTFKVLYKIRIWGKDMIVREESDDLYNAIETARTHLARKIIDEKHRWVHLRRGNARLEGLLISDDASRSTINEMQISKTATLDWR